MRIVRNGIKRSLAVIVSLSMAVGGALPSAAIAAEDSVHLDAQSTASEASKEVSDLQVGDVDAPKAGQALDDTATITTKEGEKWDVPVLWIAPDLELATTANGGELPVIAYFMPQEYRTAPDARGGYTLRFSKDLQKIWGGQNIIAILDAATGVTYLVPESVRGYFEQARQVESAEAETGAGAEMASEPAAEEVQAADEDEIIGYGDGENYSLIDIYCAKTARNALGEDDLDWLIDLVINKLQPQAVNLLVSKFPAFQTAAQNGELGKQMGFYVYYLEGDNDGDPAHTDLPRNGLAYVAWNWMKKDDETVKYGYVLGVDASSISGKDESGKLVLQRSGYGFDIFQNTIVHEMFHGLMDDYNRTGMTGTTSTKLVAADIDGRTKERRDEYNLCRYPTWFIEGTASAVENNLQFRKDVFAALVAEVNDGGNHFDQGSQKAILYNYLNSNKKFNLGYSYNNDADVNTVARYSTGYLAVLYLGELAARKDPNIGSSYVMSNPTTVTRIDSTKIRLGLNSILERMHKGETLDQVISDISPVDPSDGEKYFPNTDKFEDRFIAGFQYKRRDGSKYYDVNPSSEFVFVFLNRMNQITQNSKYGANGSILDDFYKDYRSPLDPTKTTECELYKTMGSNTYVESSVPSEQALKGGGKSKSGTPQPSKTTSAPVARAAKSADKSADESADKSTTKNTTVNTAKNAKSDAAANVATDTAKSTEKAVAKDAAKAETKDEGTEATKKDSSAENTTAEKGGATTEAEKESAVVPSSEAENTTADADSKENDANAAPEETTPEEIVPAEPVVDAQPTEPVAEPVVEPVVAEPIVVEPAPEVVVPEVVADVPAAEQIQEV